MALRWPLIVRRTHKWLALVLGVQALLWAVTGFYMVSVHIDIIHGDHLVRSPRPEPFDLRGLAPPEQVVAAAPGVTEVRLQRLFGKPVWRAETAQGSRLFDGRSGQPLADLSEAEIRTAARALYAGSGRIVAARLLTTAPLEMQSRKPPYWQVEFEGWSRPTLYLAPQTGELVARRHALWRVFDFAWMLHIMDYDERSDVNNPLLRIATWSALAMALTGATLLIWAFPRRRRKRPA